MIDSNSRYYSIEIAIYTELSGEQHAYLRRRFLPDPQQATIISEYLVAEGDRPDLLTARSLGDPEQFWRVCDANYVDHPNELTEQIGRRVGIPYPEA
jgi:hypothetical protein